MTATPKAGPRGRLQLVLLATLFFFPLLASYVLYFWFPQYRPDGTTNFGELVNPAQPLPIESLQLVDGTGEPVDPNLLRGRWTYLILAHQGCDDRCLRTLVMTRQVRLSLNEKRSRVQSVLVVETAETAARLAQSLKAEHPQLKVVADLGGGDQASLWNILKPADAAMYLSDPLGNWLMHYGPLINTAEGTRDDFKHITKDIKRLLRLSQIG